MTRFSKRRRSQLEPSAQPQSEHQAEGFFGPGRADPFFAPAATTVARAAQAPGKDDKERPKPAVEAAEKERKETKEGKLAREPMPEEKDKTGKVARRLEGDATTEAATGGEVD
jgi:hypothetical protein